MSTETLSFHLASLVETRDFWNRMQSSRRLGIIDTFLCKAVSTSEIVSPIMSYYALLNTADQICTELTTDARKQA